MVERLTRLARGLRRPTAVRTLEAPVWSSDHAVLSLAAAISPEDAARNMARLAGLSPASSTLVIPSTASRPGRGSHPRFVAALLDSLGPNAVIGVQPGTPGPVRGRWERLARQRGANSVRLGGSGWNRVELSGEAFLLDEVFLPAELVDYELVIAVPALFDESLALGFAREIAHPHTRLRARGTAKRARIDAEIASAARLSFAIDGSRLPGVLAASLAAWAPDALSGELAGEGLRHFIDSARGREGVTAWEQERVQAASELGIGPATGESLLIRVEESDRAARPVAEYLARELSCRIAWVAGEDLVV